MIKYEGWTLTDKIILVSRPERGYGDGKWTTLNSKQAYVVDPNNSEMLKSARYWAEITVCGDYDEETKTYPNKQVIKGEEFELDNKDFTLELLDSAEESSQGGKLSFWNCLIHTPVGDFKIGISADLLLSVLKFCDFKKGICQQKLCFARKKGQVGLLNEDMPEYKQALEDMQKKKNIKKGATKKWELGKVYGSLTLADAHLAKFYQWCEVQYKMGKYGHYICGIDSITILSKPRKVYWNPSYEEEYKKVSDYINYYTDDKLTYFKFDLNMPARKQISEIEMDVPQNIIHFNLNSKFRQTFIQLKNQLDDYNKKGYSFGGGMYSNIGSCIENILTYYKDNEVPEIPNDVINFCKDNNIEIKYC